jgi:perosamine synthetase
LHEKIKLLRGQGMTKDRRYWHEVVGYNYRMTNMQAALGCAQMERIVNFIKAKRENAKLYKKLLKSEPQIILPIEKPYAKSNFWMFTILLGEKLTGKRDEIMEKLKTMGIESRVVFYPLSDMPVYLESGEKLLVSKKMAYRGITLPSSTKLTRSDIKYICDSLKKIISDLKKTKK